MHKLVSSLTQATVGTNHLVDIFFSRLIKSHAIRITGDVKALGLAGTSASQVGRLFLLIDRAIPPRPVGGERQ